MTSQFDTGGVVSVGFVVTPNGLVEVPSWVLDGPAGAVVEGSDNVDPRDHYYTVPHPDDPETLICRGFYQNCGDVQVALVAVVNVPVGDLGVYIGGTYRAQTEAETLVEAARHGNKVGPDLAALYFAELQTAFLERR